MIKSWEEIRRIWEPYDAPEDGTIQATAGDVRDLFETIAAIHEEVEQLRSVKEAAQELDVKLDIIWSHPSYMGQVTMAHVHGYEYDGPNCGEEQKALKEALKEVEKEKVTMPMYSFSCPSCGHKQEEIIGFYEQDELVQEYGKVVIPCEICGNQSIKEEGIEITADMNRTWADQTWGKATK